MKFVFFLARHFFASYDNNNNNDNNDKIDLWKLYSLTLSLSANQGLALYDHGRRSRALIESIFCKHYISNTYYIYKYVYVYNMLEHNVMACIIMTYNNRIQS